MKIEPLPIKQPVIIWPVILCLACLVIAILLAWSHKDQTSLSGNLELVSTIIWSSEATTFYPNLLDRQEVEKGELVGWTLDSSQYLAAQTLLAFVQEGKVEADTLEYLGSYLGFDNPTTLFALQTKDIKPIFKSTIPSTDKITQLEFTLDSLRRVWSQTGAKSSQNDLLRAIQEAESSLNQLKRRRERALLESDKKQGNTIQSWNFKLLHTMIDSLLERNQVFALDRGVFIVNDPNEKTVSYVLKQVDPQWVTFIPATEVITSPQNKNPQHLRSPEQEMDFPILEVKSQDRGWLLKLHDTQVLSEPSGYWTILDQEQHTLLKRWFAWRNQ